MEMKRILMVMLCAVLVAALCGTSVACAATTTITVSADRTEAEPGDTVAFTIVFGPVKDFGSYQMKLVIPDGLTYVSGSFALDPSFVSATGFSYNYWNDNTLVAHGNATAADYNSNGSTVFAAFSCTVDEGFSGTTDPVSLTKLEFVSCQAPYTDHTADYSVKAAVVTVGGAEDPNQDPNAGENTTPDPNAGENTTPDLNAGENTQPGENTDPGENTGPGGDTQPGENTTPEDSTEPGESTAPADNTQPGDDTAPDNGSEGSQTPSDGSNTNEADNSSSRDKNASEGQNKGSEGQPDNAQANTNSADGAQEQQNTGKGLLSLWYVPVIAVVVIVLAVIAAKRRKKN